MDKFNFSSKHMAISKANAQMIAVVGIASFIVVFCLVASKAVLSQYQYQSRVISASNIANDQLKTNITAYQSLVGSYVRFNTTKPIVLSNTVAGSPNDNVQTILDALPGAYDFPGLTSTVENILNCTGLSTSICTPMQISGVTGSDQQATQQADNSSASPRSVPMPFGFSVINASNASAQQLIQLLQQSIRPMSVDSINLTASSGSLTMTVAAHSYYQPTKTLSISKETIN